MSAKESVPVLRGRLVTLRGVIERDRADRLLCPQEAEFVRMMGGEAGEIGPFTPERAQRWYEHRLERGDWVIEYEDRCVGHCGLTPRAPAVFSFGIGIWEPAAWGKGAGTEATRLVLRNAFGALRAHRVELRVFAHNARAIRCYEKCGFVLEGRERERHVEDGRWWDDLVMGVLDREYGARAGEWDLP
jgi:RimJ/RimL family protein N-acetyltransferase